MSPKASHALRIAISLGLAVGLFALFLRHVDLATVWKAIRGAHAGWLVVAVVISLAVIPARSWRWRLLFEHVGHAPLWDATIATAIGFAATTLLPLRAGEVVRPVALSRSARLPLPPLLVSVLLERLLDLVTVIFLFVVYAIGWAPTGLGGEAASRFALLRKSALVLGAGTFLGLVVLALLAVRPSLTGKLTDPFLKRLPVPVGRKLSGLLASLLAGLGALGRPSHVLRMALASVGLWLLICAQIHVTLLAFDLRFPYPITFFVLTWAVVGLAVPTPGGVGGYHAAVAYALTGFHGVGANAAAAFALVSHALSFAPVTIVGLLLLGGGGLKLGSLAAPPPADGAKTSAVPE